MSTTERPVSAFLKTMLVNNEPFQYANLIKFERPSRPDTQSGLVSTKYNRYTYLTDASIDVPFNDGSKDLEGNLNGTQVYLANKVLSVGSIQEQTKATTSTTSIVLDGTALGASITGTATISVPGGTVDSWDIAFAAPISTEDILAEGFREGDKVTINGTPVNINSFRANNTIRVTKVDTALTAGTLSITMNLASEEVLSILLNKNATDYSSFINREVYIYRAYFQEGAIVGAPILMFKGIIYNVNFEDSETSIRVTWGLTSHWGDFAQVKGRITSDAFHRALNESGAPQPNSALKPIYAYDKGFSHSETSINILAKYIVQVEKQDIKTKKGFFGIGAKVKVKKYFVPEDRFTNLDFQLNSKAIPLIYGVRNVEGTPIFADTLNSDSATVYTATALCEGEIGGIYDVYIDGSSLICNDKADFDTRSQQTTDNTVALVCRGRADRGDALGGVASISTSGGYPYYGAAGESQSILNPITFNLITSWWGIPYIPPVTTTTYSTSGLIDGDSISLTSPISMTLDVFSGKSGQKASAQLSEIAYNKNFKIQNNYWMGSDTAEYWGPNHKLLDTAYVVGKFKIAEGETSIPTLTYVVRGKVIDCYNYDYSYLHDRKASGEQDATYHENFILGETVTLRRSDTGAIINPSVQIIDKWTFKNPDGTDNIRFRFSTRPAIYGAEETGIPVITKFYMEDASANKWTMTTFNHNILASASVAGPISSPITSVTGSGANIIFNYTSNSYMTIENDPYESSAKFQVVKSNYDSLTSGNLLPYAVMAGTISATAFTSQYAYNSYSGELGALLASFPGALLASKSTIRLPTATADTTTLDYYKGDIVEVTRYNSTTGKSLIQTAEIVGYNQTSQIATIDTIWDFIPTSTDTVRIYPKYADGRVSINTAIQCLDYISSKTYGRGLDIYKDIDLPSWTETARKCDTQSNVTLLSSSAVTLPYGEVYRYPATGNIVWQGSAVGTTASTYSEFTNVIGKLTNKWNSWKTWAVGDIIYNPTTYQLYRVDTAGVVTTAPTHSGTSGILTNLTSLTIYKSSGGTGPASITLNISNGNPIQSLRGGQKISGYSLYDSDDINYWRLSGWDQHSQRYVTRVQTNIQLDTALPLFDNMNGLLEHFNGILRYTAGKYYLDIEDAAGTIATSDIRTITTDDIIGKIQLSDEGARSAFNSLTAAFADPANKFEAKNISFFNSEFLKADRNVPKKGNLSVPGVTNYYNTRLLADSYLIKSRYGLTINMTIRYHGILLLAGSIIQVIYPRYDWNTPGKKFRIESVNYQPDGLVDVVAKEYDDSFYTMSNIKQSGGTGATTIPVNTGIGRPTNLIVTSADTADELLNGVELFWDNDSNANNQYVYTEVYGGLSSVLYIYISTITTDGTKNTLTTSAAHGLVPGMTIYPKSTANGIDSTLVYYVVDTPSTTTFTISDTKNSAAINTLTVDSGLTLQVMTATLLGTVPVPIRSYIDTVVNEGTGRVEKYYWVRHKVNQV